MFIINKYESLKVEGTWNDSIEYVLSLANKNELENYLKQSSSYEDLKMLIFLSKSTKNLENLFEIFKTNSLPIKQRTIAGINWLKIQTDEKQISKFIIEIINDENIPRFLKNKIFENLHRINCFKKSLTFFYNLTCELTKSIHHEQYNLDAHLVPFYSKDQILNLLTQWSIQRFEQITSTSLFRSKLIHYQPCLVIHLIQCDLNERQGNEKQLLKYFQDNDQLFALLARKEAKIVFRLIIKYLHQLEKHQQLLPNFIQSNQRYFFKKVPEEMIELIIIVGSIQPGTIKYRTNWCDEGYDLESFSFPRSFSLEHYIRLFLGLYNTCQWSSNYTIRIFQYILQNHHQHSGLSSIRKRRKLILDIIINQHIGRDVFIEKLLNEGDETTLKLFEEYIEITTLLSRHLITQYEMNKTLLKKQRLELIRYQIMTEDIFNEFLTLFSQTNSNINQRQKNYVIFLQSALSTDAKQVKNVLQWIVKRFTNEQLTIIEYFLSYLKKLNIRFQLEILPENFELIDTIIQFVLHHRQQTINTLQILFDYALTLLQRIEHYQNIEIREKIQTFAIRIIKQSFSNNNADKLHIQSLSESYPIARQYLSNLFISDLFPKLLSKFQLDQLNDLINYSLEKPWRLCQIDSFLRTFFFINLPSSTKLQSVFQIDRHSSMISIFLKTPSTQFERCQHLIENIDRIFFLNEIVQRIILRSKQYRLFIDQLLEDEQCLTFEKLSNNQMKISTNIKLPGFHITILNSSFYYLTGKQQEYITKIILNDFIQDKEITNSKKLKALRVLYRLTHTYNQSLQWFENKQNSSIKIISDDDVNPLDHIFICLPVRFDLTLNNFLKQFEFLKMKLNASNAKYISDTMRMISYRIPEQIFLEEYLRLVQNEQFQKLGITANKEILRLLTEYSSNSSLIQSVIQPLWASRPHQDIRACLIFTLLYFLGKTSDNDEQKILWQILEEATRDSYLPVVQSLFADYRGCSRWPLTRLINSSNEIFEKFINEIQFQILDHPTSLEARLWAWSNIDNEHVDFYKLMAKGKQLCVQFDQNANTLWERAFNQILSSHLQQNISPLNITKDIIQILISRRDEIDSKENGIDSQHDLPVYHRIHRILTILTSHIQQFDTETKHSFRPLTVRLIQFDKTFALLIGTFLIKIAQNRDDLQSMLFLLEENLSEDYFERILTELGNYIAKEYSNTFIQHLNIQEKLQLAQWLIEEHDRGLFVFELLKRHVFNRSNIDREQCQNLLRRMRLSENLCLRQQAMEYTVKWKRKKEKCSRKNTRINVPCVSLNTEEVSIDLFDIFDAVEKE